MKKLIVDVRSREEFVMAHIEGAINIPHYDLEHYRDLLRERPVAVYCNTGHRAAIAAGKLQTLGIAAEVLPADALASARKQGKTMVCAINTVHPLPGQEEEFMARAAGLCRAIEEFPGFLGSKIMKMSGISAAGSFLPGDARRLDVSPPAYLLLTFWESEEAHERSHQAPPFAEIFQGLPPLLARLPYEEFYQVLK